MKTQALLAAATLLVALPAAGFPAAVLPAAAVEPAHLVADLDPGLAPFHPSGDHADWHETDPEKVLGAAPDRGKAQAVIRLFGKLTT